LNPPASAIGKTEDALPDIFIAARACVPAMPLELLHFQYGLPICIGDIDIYVAVVPTVNILVLFESITNGNSRSQDWGASWITFKAIENTQACKSDRQAYYVVRFKNDEFRLDVPPKNPLAYGSSREPF
jgi:hypothetical protein